ncbi:unnamed protein product [Ostreobium quekettii]|uniref:Protein N-terminal glutamine amidohydrolase n=1 Tax=Ostreobium quekettii TaxID=121088 RepID=A0A8S1J6L2_9CHLO|nr:unnamed protein product [Ostreobium quekettii]|eukprot:evm.model.scf_193.6 EVM.evm.TU.scf_193.6   scf_193:55178-58649(-)
MTPAPTAPALSRADCTYTSCYCEENVHRLIDTLLQRGLAADAGALFAVFISNPSRTVPLWAQRKGLNPEGLVIWDYHVILIQEVAGSGDWLVWDLDTSLDFPVPFADYAGQAFKTMDWALGTQFDRFFRVIPAAAYLDNFASDRSHMVAEDGSWKAPPPEYPCLVAKNGDTMTLSKYLDMSIVDSQDERWGSVMDEETFLEPHLPIRNTDC